MLSVLPVSQRSNLSNLFSAPAAAFPFTAQANPIISAAIA